MALSTNRFRQGGRGAGAPSSMPMTLTPARTTAPYTLSGSWGMVTYPMGMLP